MRPGLDPGNWASRAALTACGIISTGPAEISIYKQAHYAQPTAHLVRYTLRTEGFISINAPLSGGQAVTRPFVFSGSQVVLNSSTSAVGSIKVQLEDADGKPLPGFGLSECAEIIGDEIRRTVTWAGNPDLGKWAGKPVRLRFALRDADLYSVQFDARTSH